MDVETPLYWAYYERYIGNDKEALGMLVRLMKEFEIDEKMEIKKKAERKSIV